MNAIYEDHSGNLWVGTVEGGLNKKAAGSDSFIHYTHESGTLTHNSVSAITADGQGRLWIGTWGGGINLINPQNPQHRIEAITAENKDRLYRSAGLRLYQQRHVDWSKPRIILLRPET